jgi:hypothetical protein
VLKHASLEEAEEHPKISASVDSAQLQRLGEAFRAAEAEASRTATELETRRTAR